MNWWQSALLIVGLYAAHGLCVRSAWHFGRASAFEEVRKMNKQRDS
jgi:hypothetical protein